MTLNKPINVNKFDDFQFSTYYLWEPRVYYLDSGPDHFLCVWFCKKSQNSAFLKLLSVIRRLVKNCLHEIPRIVILNLNTSLSNQYYMSGKRSELAILVHELWKIDKYTYESCVATANYYSLREERTEAIEYFERLN